MTDRAEGNVAQGATNAGRLARTAEGGHVLLSVAGARKYFPVKGAALRGRGVGTVKAVDGIDLELRRGETLGLVGESGCGKSTFARCLLGLLPLTGGRVIFDGRDITNLPRREMRRHRRDMQMVFQDPMGSLNPRRRVGSIIGDPLAVHGVSSGAERKRRVQELMELVGLHPEHYNRFPMEFSGGQRQRIGVARALALRPKLIICDEPVSALDVSIQAQILNLLKSLQSEFGLTYLFISHDLGVVEHISDRVAVMYLGRLAEVGEVGELYDQPRHPYTAALLSAAPVPDPRATATRQQIILGGDPPSPADPPSGCRFHPRCPKAQAMCSVEEPALMPRLGDAVAHVTACHFPVEPGDDLSRSPAAGELPGMAGNEALTTLPASRQSSSDRPRAYRTGGASPADSRSRSTYEAAALRRPTEEPHRGSAAPVRGGSTHSSSRHTGNGPPAGEPNHGTAPAGGSDNQGPGPAAGPADQGPGPVVGSADHGPGPVVGSADQGPGPVVGLADQGRGPVVGEPTVAGGSTYGPHPDAGSAYTSALSDSRRTGESASPSAVRTRRDQPGPGSRNVDPWFDDPFADDAQDSPHGGRP